jgi:hypothetical protein
LTATPPAPAPLDPVETDMDGGNTRARPPAPAQLDQVETDMDGGNTRAPRGLG